jgi:predicted nucleic acid-binding protein
VILVDTGPLVAAGNRADEYPAKCVRALTTAAAPRLVPATVVAETGYLLERAAGPAVEATFLGMFTSGFLKLADLTADDLSRAAEPVEQYANSPLGTTDATIVAVAERLEIATIATLDTRHFNIVRPRHVDASTVVPQQA